MIDALFLVRNGVPFDVAFTLPAATRTEWVVALGTLSGRVFDWSQMNWEDEA